MNVRVKNSDVADLRHYREGGLGSFTKTSAVAESGAAAEVSDIEGTSMATERELTDARLAAVEARTETRFVEIGGKIDRMSELLASSISQNSKDMMALRSEMTDVKQDNKNTRWTIAITVIVSLLAALAALWTTQGNLVSAFSAGMSLKSETQKQQQ